MTQGEFSRKVRDEQWHESLEHLHDADEREYSHQLKIDKTLGRSFRRGILHALDCDDESELIELQDATGMSTAQLERLAEM